MPSEFHHQKDGVLVSWEHACKHLSNPMYYETKEKAEEHRAGMEAVTCWPCRTLADSAIPCGHMHFDAGIIRRCNRAEGHDGKHRADLANGDNVTWEGA